MVFKSCKLGRAFHISREKGEANITPSTGKYVIDPIYCFLDFPYIYRETGECPAQIDEFFLIMAFALLGQEK
jgi:hypothetical protein